MGDFNIHIDNPKDGSAKELFYILDNFELSQHVTEPTHNKGHILDLIISKGLNISEVVVTDVAFSDHYCVFFKMAISTGTSKITTEVIRKRCINENTCTLFTQDFIPTSALPSVSVNDLVHSFSSKAMNIMDNTAPMKVKVVSGKKKTP